jgi:transposase
MKRYPKEFKEALVNKVVGESKRSMRSVAVEAQIGISTLHKWVHESNDYIKTEPVQRPCDWSTSQRFEAILKSASLDGEALNQYCRQQGFYRSQLEQWKKDFMTDKESSSLSKQQLHELKKLREQNKQLQRELYRKEKALAEVSALLVLKKKADSLWVVNEDDS